MPGMMISYRREDTIAYAGRVFDHIVQHFGAAQPVFMDIDTIEPGEDFINRIEQTVASCDVLIAVIGKDWLTAADGRGRRRLDDPGDFVRVEISAALGRGIRVIPVLVGGARMPRPDELPEPLAPLCRRNALEISDTSFHPGVARLIESVEKASRMAAAEQSVRKPGRHVSRRTAAALLSAGILTVSGVVVYMARSRSRVMPEPSKVVQLAEPDRPGPDTSAKPPGVDAEPKEPAVRAVAWPSRKYQGFWRNVQPGLAFLQFLEIEATAPKQVRIRAWLRCNPTPAKGGTTGNCREWKPVAASVNSDHVQWTYPDDPLGTSRVTLKGSNLVVDTVWKPPRQSIFEKADPAEGKRPAQRAAIAWVSREYEGSWRNIDPNLKFLQFIEITATAPNQVRIAAWLRCSPTPAQGGTRGNCRQWTAVSATVEADRVQWNYPDDPVGNSTVTLTGGRLHVHTTASGWNNIFERGAEAPAASAPVEWASKQYHGFWRNVDPSAGFLQFIDIVATAPDEVRIRAWLRCEPTPSRSGRLQDCVHWKPVGARVHTDRLLWYYPQDPAGRNTVTLEGTRLVVRTATTGWTNSFERTPPQKVN